SAAYSSSMKWPPSNRRSRASGRSRCQVKVRPALRTNSPEGVLGFLRGGGGISTLPRYIVSEDLRSGRLKQLLPQWRLPGGGIYLTWPGGRDAPAKVRAFVDFLRERAGPAQAAFAASLPKTRRSPSADTTTVSPAPNSPARIFCA